MCRRLKSHHRLRLTGGAVSSVKQASRLSIQIPCEYPHALRFMQVSVATVALVLSSIALLTPSAQAATNYTDADILQFALNLEV